MLVVLDMIIWMLLTRIKIVPANRVKLSDLTVDAAIKYSVSCSILDSESIMFCWRYFFDPENYMAELKTKTAKASVTRFLDSIENQKRRSDGYGCSRYLNRQPN
jgi:hypothetical protein